MFLGIVEKWCPSTNSIFPWDEAIITLEDIIVLGGFCVIGEPISKPLKTIELMNIEEKVRKIIGIRNKSLLPLGMDEAIHG